MMGSGENGELQLKGRWGFMLKLLLTVFPIFMGLGVTWGTWVTAETFKSSAFRLAGDRFTRSDGLSLQRDLELYHSADVRQIQADWVNKHLEIEHRIQDLPSVKKDVEELMKAQREIMSSLARVEAILERMSKEG